jgi:hypothetical protein
VVQECRYIASAEADNLEEMYRKLDSENADVWSADLDRLVCPYLPICDPILDGQIVKLDGSHLTARYTTAIAPSIDAYLKDNAVLPG